MLSLAGVHLSFGERTILDEVSLTLATTTRAALVGANGSGKSTLLRVLAGELQPDAGRRTAAKGFLVSYLPQRVQIEPMQDVFSHAERAYTRMAQLSIDREAAAAELQHHPNQHDAAAAALLAQVARIDELLVHSGYHERHVAIGRVLSGLGFNEAEQRRPVGTFSGGWQMRIELARVLLEHPDLLLLDEPTNYLDSEARWWLARYLSGYPGGVCIVSHDRAFLDEVVQEVYEVFLAQVKRYRGNYSTYHRVRQEEIERLVASYHLQQREIARQEDFIRRFRAKATKARQVQSRVKQLEKIERIEIPEHLQPIRISIPAAPKSGDEVVVIEDLHKRYSDLVVLDGVTGTVRRGERWAVIGPNGAGKTTLLRILAGTEHASAGSVRFGTGVQSAYYAQDSADTLIGDTTILEYAETHAPYEKRPYVRDFLGSFLFRSDEVFKPLHVLSGGERSRLVLATLLLRPVNLLILDEPTNHLDMTSQQVLLEALTLFQGTVIFVSHDRYFVDQLATTVLDLATTSVAGRELPWRVYPGTFPEYRDLLALSTQPTERALSGKVGATVVASPTPTTSTDFARQKQRRSELQRFQRRERELISAIESLEREQAETQNSLADPAVYASGERVKAARTRLTSIETELAELHREWEDLLEIMETADAP